MAQTARNTNRRNYRENRYVSGSAAPKFDIRKELEDDRQIHRLSQATRKNREKLHAISPAYAVVLMFCLCTAVGVIIWYVNLQSMVTSQVATINQLETKLNTLRQTNDEENLRIENSIDLEEIKKIAIGELGMTYAQEGQIVMYTGEVADYMRKVVED